MNPMNTFLDAENAQRNPEVNRYIRAEASRTIIDTRHDSNAQIREFVGRKSATAPVPPPSEMSTAIRRLAGIPVKE